MTLKDIQNRIYILKSNIDIYEYILHNEKSILKNDTLISRFIKSHKSEIDTLNEMIYLQEYDGEGGNSEQRY